MNEPVAEAAASERIAADLLEQINAGRTFDELFNRLYDLLHGVVPYHRIAVALLDPGGEQLRLISCRSDGEMALKLGYADPVQGSTLDELLRTGQPRIINDLEDYLARKPESRSTRLIVREGMRSNLTLPLLSNGVPIGVVFFSSRAKDAYHEGHISLLRPLAGHIAISVEKMQYLEALEERNKELAEANALQVMFLQRLQEEVERRTHELGRSERRYHLLADLGRLLNNTLDLRQVFERAALEVHHLLGCDRVSLILVTPEERTRHGFALEFGAGPAAWVAIPVQPLAGSAAEWVWQQRQVRIARRLAEARPFVEDRTLFSQGYRAYLYLPLLGRDGVLGVWGLATQRDDVLDGWDLPLLHELAGVLASAVGNAAAYEEIARLRAQLERENTYLRAEEQEIIGFGQLIGTSVALEVVRQAIAQVGPTDSTVLITGETGTGKERIAEALHAASRRHDRLLVKVNCAALAPALVTSELFGHEAGAFTGAVKTRAGRFEVAQEGTIFLDEVAELSPETQVLLLRVLQERRCERVGSNEPLDLDVRVIAATNKDLQQGVAEGWFRDDLFYRLNVFPLHVPPLRERKDDIPALVDHFLARYCRRMHRGPLVVPPQVLELLATYDWPGNIRELENLIERAVIVSTAGTLSLDPTWLRPPAVVASPAPAGSFADTERRAIRDALERCGGKIYGRNGAAAFLGLKPTTLYGKMRKLGIPRPRRGSE
jgi:formate hydrogenlyase transcriptional activator